MILTWATHWGNKETIVITIEDHIKNDDISVKQLENMQYSTLKWKVDNNTKKARTTFSIPYIHQMVWSDMVHPDMYFFCKYSVNNEILFLLFTVNWKQDFEQTY